MDKMGFEKIRIIQERINKRPMLSFILIFIIIFPVMMLLVPYLRSPYASFFQNTGNFFFNNCINECEDIQRNVRILRTSDNKKILKVDIGFLDCRLQNGQIMAKLIQLDTQKEGLIPYLFLMSLIIASPVSLRKKGMAFLYGTIIMHLWVLLKFNVQLLDNYNYPNLVFIELPFLLDTIVFYFNAFIRVTGASSALIIPIIIWIIVTYEKEAIIRIKNSFLGKKE